MVVERNPKDSMKSTWRTSDRSDWTYHHHVSDILNMHPTNLNEPIPVHQKDDKMPSLSSWSCHVWILTHALWPILLHQLYCNYTGHNMSPYLAFPYYTLAFHVNSIREVHVLRKLGHRWGFLDGDKHERDQVPDVSVGKVVQSLTLTAVVRPLFTVFMAYRTSQAPVASLSLWLPVEIGLYGIVLDFYFYW